MPRDKFDTWPTTLECQPGLEDTSTGWILLHYSWLLLGISATMATFTTQTHQSGHGWEASQIPFPANRTKFLSSIATLKYLLNANGWSPNISLCTNDIFRIVPHIARAIWRLSGRSGREQEIRRTNSRVLGSVLLHSRLILEMREPRRNLKRGRPALWQLSSPSEPLGSGLGSENSSMVGWRTFN